MKRQYNCKSQLEIRITLAFAFDSLMSQMIYDVWATIQRKCEFSVEDVCYYKLYEVLYEAKDNFMQRLIYH